MPQVTYIEHNGTAHEIELEEGLSVMRGAVDNGVPGIDADCGGECACATCHVFVEEPWLEKTGEPSEQEASMLSFAATAQPNSRLSCQIIMSPALDGMGVRPPEGQHGGRGRDEPPRQLRSARRCLDHAARPARPGQSGALPGRHDVA